MYKYIKRILDIIISLILLVILSPLFLIISLLIICDSKGSIIFKQKRTGYKGKTFVLYKFRTMDIDNNINDLKTKNKITNLGKYLRKYSLDELPQLINVIKGDMSLIGPRPWIPIYYKNFTKEQKRRLDVYPGITGLAQACGRNSISVFDKIKLDIKYVDDFSFERDLKVIYWSFKTICDNTNDITKEGIINEVEALKENKAKENEDRLDEYLNCI